MKKLLIGTAGAVVVICSSISFAAAASWSQFDLNRSFTDEISSQQNTLNRLCTRLNASNLFRGRMPRFCTNFPQASSVSVSLSVSSGQVVPGGSTTLSWQSSGATYCAAANGWSGNKPLNGNQMVTVSTTTAYAISCGNATSSSTARVTINAAPLSQKPPCSDSLDNDGDTRVDYPEDTGCTGSADISEETNAQVSVTNSSTPESQTIPRDIPNQPLGGFTISIVGEPMSVEGMIFTVATSSASSGLLYNVTLHDSSGVVYAGPVDATWQGGVQTIRFNNQVGFQPGTYSFVLYGKVPFTATSGAKLTLSTKPSSWVNPKSDTTGDSVSLSNTSAFSMNTMTIAQ